MVVVNVVVIDQITKSMLAVSPILNAGISFSWLSDLSSTLLIVQTLLLIALAFEWVRLQKAGGGVAKSLAYSLIFAGGFSNALDRLLLGGVRDWLAVPFSTISNNLADYAIALGVLVWLGTMLSERPHAT